MLFNGNDLGDVPLKGFLVTMHQGLERHCIQETFKLLQKVPLFLLLLFLFLLLLLLLFLLPLSHLLLPLLITDCNRMSGHLSE